MRQELKTMGCLLLMMSLFSSSQEKTCVVKTNCVSAPVVAIQKTPDPEYPSNEESELPLMPISKFILLQ